MLKKLIFRATLLVLFTSLKSFANDYQAIRITFINKKYAEIFKESINLSDNPGAWILLEYPEKQSKEMNCLVLFKTALTKEEISRYLIMHQAKIFKIADYAKQLKFEF